MQTDMKSAQDSNSTKDSDPVFDILNEYQAEIKKYQKRHLPLQLIMRCSILLCLILSQLTGVVPTTILFIPMMIGVALFVPSGIGCLVQQFYQPEYKLLRHRLVHIQSQLALQNNQNLLPLLNECLEKEPLWAGHYVQLLQDVRSMFFSFQGELSKQRLEALSKIADELATPSTSFKPFSRESFDEVNNKMLNLDKDRFGVTAEILAQFSLTYPIPVQVKALPAIEVKINEAEIPPTFLQLASQLYENITTPASKSGALLSIRVDRSFMDLPMEAPVQAPVLTPVRGLAALSVFQRAQVPAQEVVIRSSCPAAPLDEPEEKQRSESRDMMLTV